MAFLFYANIQSTRFCLPHDNLAKSDGKIYFTEDDALRAIILDGTEKTRQVQPIVAMTEEDYRSLVNEIETLKKKVKS